MFLNVEIYSKNIFNDSRNNAMLLIRKLFYQPLVLNIIKNKYYIYTHSNTLNQNYFNYTCNWFNTKMFANNKFLGLNIVKGIIFKDIDSLVNYYVIDADALNDQCTADFENGGISPVSGQANVTMVVKHDFLPFKKLNKNYIKLLLINFFKENLQKLVNDAGIVNTKLLYGIKMLPTSNTNNNVCNANYQKVINILNIL